MFKISFDQLIIFTLSICDNGFFELDNKNEFIHIHLEKCKDGIIYDIENRQITRINNNVLIKFREFLKT